MRTPQHPLAQAGLWALALGSALALTACGGGGGDAGAAASLTTTSKTIVIDEATLPPDAASQTATPSFHIAPVVLDEPADTDALDNAASANRAPHKQDIAADDAALPTRGLTVEALKGAQRLRKPGTLSPLATSSTVTTYTPAQIRAAYGLPALPATGATPTAAQAAQMGAGQTIYIVDAMHNPNVAAELSAFNQRFGLPGCTTKAIAATATLPLAAPSLTEGCTLSVVYSTQAGGMTTTAPAYDAGWATEIALDVQWAHATAPLARIVLIESADASLNGLLGGVKLANAMGPGAVSMSFGGNEGSWTGSVDSAFAGTNMTYLAATGDSGTAVSWPAVSPKVVAVGGTSLTYSGTGKRAESAWSSAGGGVSLYTAAPSYQTSLVPGLGQLGMRAVADVAFNANPSTGQFVAVISPGNSTPSWVSAGGTSLSTPQWAGLVAVANALRAQSAKAPLGAPHSLLYGQIATVPGSYAANFADVTTGANGSCPLCLAHTGYDAPTGLGTPNAGSLLGTLGGATMATAPVVNATTVTGKPGMALSFTITSSATNPVTYSLSGAPSGMVVGSTGVVSWPSPVAGSYSVTATVKDTKTGLSGQGVYTVKIDALAVAPVVKAATVNGNAGTALSYTVQLSAGTATAYALSGAPSGMAVSAAGVVSWPSPVVGSYAVTVKATNGSLSGSGVLTVVIAKATSLAPVITAPAITGVAGRALSGSISVSSPAGRSLSITITGVPSGVQFAASGQVLSLSWPSPVTGSYSLVITATDSTGLRTQATMPITINAK